MKRIILLLALVACSKTEVVEEPPEPPPKKVKPIIKNCGWDYYYDCYACDFCYGDYIVVKCLRGGDR